MLSLKHGKKLVSVVGRSVAKVRCRVQHDLPLQLCSEVVAATHARPQVLDADVLE